MRIRDATVAKQGVREVAAICLIKKGQEVDVFSALLVRFLKEAAYAHRKEKLLLCREKQIQRVSFNLSCMDDQICLRRFSFKKGRTRANLSHYAVSARNV